MKNPKKAYLGLRISKELHQKISKIAAFSGQSKTAMIIARLEQGFLKESLNNNEIIQAIDSLKQDIKSLHQTGKASHSAFANPQGHIPPEILKKIVFSSAFSEFILQTINTKIHQNPSEIGQIALQARRQALAETGLLIEKMNKT